ncbi:MAG: glycosyltransferase family 8 protein [Deltaproteobacteria bacterium HGW-Deltaproteobacteria-13]|jgi:lipopolysaccharide biosynthesis glycosyltransferase|nr:MAG: glycosyltransferase family 8 protein [Deltaproteobacteria bacterium HGW-Deltaproteobacteria-13]
MNVVFATDRGYLQHLAVALISLLANNSGMNVYVINQDISGTDWRKLEKLFAGKDSKLIDAKIDDRRIERLITHSYFTKANYYRLFIPDIVKGDRALYLDADIVVTQRIDDLYHTEISDTFLAAVDNPEINNRYDLEMESSAKYFNSGVMLINLEYWRAHTIKEKVIEFVSRKPEVIRFVDQDGLNSVINGQWRELHPKYNLHTVLLSSDYASDPQIREAMDNPVIIHYTGLHKPWHLGDSHPYKRLYWKYLRMTPYKYSIPDDINMINILRRIIPKPMKESIKKYLGAKFK